MKLPSLHLPVIWLAGLLVGLGMYYTIALADELWAVVVIGAVLIIVFEWALRASRAVIYRLGARPEDEEPRMPKLYGRERYIAVLGLALGLGAGYAIWGPVLSWQNGGGA